MTNDVNAAVRGVLAAEPTAEIVISDGHGNANNILIEELDPHARLNTGTNAPFSMVQGIGPDVQAAIFVGYHARVGTPNAILDHTWSSKAVYNVWLNGVVVGEVGLNAAVCGHFGAPVILVTGDQSVAAEARALLGAVETVEVKQASSRVSADCLPPALAQAQIQEGAKRAVSSLLAGSAPAPFLVSTPVTAGIEFHFTEMADVAGRMPGMRRIDGRTLEFTAADMVEAYKTFRASVVLGRAA
jgi:D-amino peptidase